MMTMPTLPSTLEARLTEIDRRLPQLARAAATYYSAADPGHDWLHVLRVAEEALSLGRAMGADLAVLLPAALFHDAVNLAKNDPRRTEAGALSSEVAVTVLEGTGYAAEECCRIARVIREHSYTLNLPPSSLEAAILQDADKLDAIGAIGVLRAAVCGVRLGSDFYDRGDPFCEDRPPDDSRHMIDHFYAKLLVMEPRFRLPLAKREARRRIEFMKGFLAQLKSELPASATPARGAAPSAREHRVPVAVNQPKGES